MDVNEKAIVVGFSSGHDALKAVSQPDGLWNWALVGPEPDRLPLEGGGEGSVDEMRRCLAKQTHANAYGLLRLTFGTGRLARIKYVFVSASNVDSDFNRRARKSFVPFTAMERGQAKAMRGAMEKALANFASYSTAIEVTEVADLTVEYVVDRVRKVSSIDNDVITVANFLEAEQLAREAAERRRLQIAEAIETAEREAIRCRLLLKREEEAEARARERARLRAREGEETRAMEKAELEARAEAERRAREEAELRAKEEAARLAREEAQRKEREEAERREHEEAQCRATEEAERKALEEAERLARMEAQRRAREEAERRVREEEEARMRAEKERKAAEKAAAAREAERRRRDEAECMLREAMQTRCPQNILRCATKARDVGAVTALLEEASELLQQLQDLASDASAAVFCGDLAQMSMLLQRAALLGATGLPEVQEIDCIIKASQQYEFVVEFPADGPGSPRGGQGWLANPLVRIEALEQVALVWIVLEDLGGDAKFGFHLIGNPSMCPASCPVPVPGGSFLAEAACQPNGVASACASLAPQQVAYCVPSLRSKAEEGGQARIRFLSVAELSCSVLPDQRWEFETVVHWEWSRAAKSVGGQRGRQTWLKNPQLRVYLDQLLQAEGQVCVLATVYAGQAVGSAGPAMVSLHAVKNRRTTSFNVHAAVVPTSYEILSAPQPVYQEAEATLCFEICKDDLLADIDETLAPPFYLIPSTTGDGVEATLELRICATAALRCERVSARSKHGTAQSRNRVATSATPPGTPRRMLELPTPGKLRRRPGDPLQLADLPGTQSSSQPGTPGSSRKGSDRMQERAAMLQTVQHEARLQARVLAGAAKLERSKDVFFADLTPSSGSTDSPKAVASVAALNRAPPNRVPQKIATPTPLRATVDEPAHDTSEASLNTAPSNGVSQKAATPTPLHATADALVISSTPTLPCVGDRVLVSERCTPGHDRQLGTVAFVGESSFSTGVWVGIAMDLPVGKNDGSVKGRRYFHCEPQCGLFVRPEAVTLAPAEGVGRHVGQSNS